MIKAAGRLFFASKKQMIPSFFESINTPLFRLASEYKKRATSQTLKRKKPLLPIEKRTDRLSTRVSFKISNAFTSLIA